jgi:nitroreductase
MELDESINKRASIREYSDKKPDMDYVLEAIEAANHAPSPGNLPILRYVIVDDPKIIKEISKACQQQFIKQSQILVIIVSETKRTKLMYDDRSLTYIKQHAGAAIENFLLKITDLGLSSCWVGAFVDRLIKDCLMIPDGFEVEAVLPVGYKIKADKTKQRDKPTLNHRLFFNEFKNVFGSAPTRVRRDDI